MTMKRAQIFDQFRSLFFILDSSGAALPDQLRTKVRKGARKTDKITPWQPIFFCQTKKLQTEGRYLVVVLIGHVLNLANSRTD